MGERAAPVPTVGSSEFGSPAMPTTSVPPYLDPTCVRAEAGPSTPSATTAMVSAVTPRRLLLLLTGPPLTHAWTTRNFTTLEGRLSTGRVRTTNAFCEACDL